LGADFSENTNALTALCGELLGGACALYIRLESDLLHSLGQWNVPEGYHPLDRPEGRVCFDLIRKDQGSIAVIRDLPETSYGETDSNGVCFGFRTYIGHVVLCSGKRVGVLSVLFKTDVELTDDDRRLLGIVASALGSEEDRRQAEEQRQSQIHFLESLEIVEYALRGTADLDRMLERVIESVRTVFDCDRAWLFYPCVPEAKTFTVPLISSNPEYAIGSDELRAQPISPESSQVIQAALDSDEPLRFDPEAGRELPDSATRFGAQSQMLMSIHPGRGRPGFLGCIMFPGAGVDGKRTETL
jgi:GAF domain-containing protein